MKKFIGKPYAGKPHVRIDEGEKRQRRFSLLYRETRYDVKDLRDLRVYATTGPRDLRETHYEWNNLRETP